MDINNRKICEGSIMIKDLDLLKDIAPLFKKRLLFGVLDI
ncbi:hypothetical protein C823_005383 [Eubacterium plexicaudatum ASF492]|nr:hypothetical protein C823_005383 [Eubacterium plexicaudatum ASF492]